jgi:hypothetical protein
VVLAARPSCTLPKKEQRKMVVYVGFRRGKWAYGFARLLLGSCMEKTLRKYQQSTLLFGQDTWMRVSLFFEQKCLLGTGARCPLCDNRDKTLPVHRGPKHCIELKSTEEKGVTIYIDAPLDKHEAWAFLRVPNADDDGLWKFALEVSSKKYNSRGAILSQLGMRADGVQKDLNYEDVPSMHCVELTLTYLQTRCVGHQYRLAPCQTTAMQLFERMMTTQNNRPAPTVYHYTEQSEVLNLERFMRQRGVEAIV